MKDQNKTKERPISRLEGLRQGVAELEKSESEHLRAKEELEKRECYFRLMPQNIHEDILVIDQDYKITDVSKTFLATVGREREDVVGRNCYEISHGYNEPCDRKGEECLLHEVFETGDPRHGRHGHIRADGSKVWVDILLSPWKDEQGNVTHVIQAIRDVTDLIEAKEALRESEELYRTLFEGASVGIGLARQDGRILTMNETMLRMMGYSKAEIDQINLKYTYVNPKKREKLLKRLQEEGVVRDFEVALKRKDGTTYYASLNIAPLRMGEEEILLTVAQDITDRKSAEKALRKRKTELVLQSRHLEEVNAALKVLLKRREEDKIELEENFLANIKELVLPCLEKLKKTQLDPHQTTLISILESHLGDVVSPFITKLSSRFLNLTPTEIQVASLIKDGKTNKEIAGLLHLSVNTIRSHRYQVRSKLGLKNQKMNLRSYLRSLQHG